MRLGARQRSQAVVEFGLIALLFTLMIFAIVDFGLLLNTWLSVSAASRDIARAAAVGHQFPYLQQTAEGLNLPSVSATGNFDGMCCDAQSAVEVKIEYLSCSSDLKTCTVLQEGQISGPNGICPQFSGAQSPCPYPVGDLNPQSAPGRLQAMGSCTGTNCHPVADDLVRVTVTAWGAQVITPLIRPFFGCTDGSSPSCNVKLQSTTVMRFEGIEF